MTKTERIIFEINCEFEHRGILCYAKSDCEHILEIESNFKKLFNLISKYNNHDTWAIRNVNHVSYFENLIYSTVDKYPNDNCNTHFKIKDVMQVELFIDDEFTVNLYVDCLDKKTGIYKSVSILINTDAQEWINEILSKGGK